jgi:hypothetical protein
MRALARLPAMRVSTVALRTLSALIRETFPQIQDAGVVRRALHAGVEAFVDSVTCEMNATAQTQALDALARAPRLLRASVLEQSCDGPCVALLSDGEWTAVRPPRGPQVAAVTVVVDGCAVGTVPHAQLRAAFS